MTWPYEKRIPVRWPDVDALGHVNNAVFLVYLDEARDDVLRETVGSFDAWPNVVVHVSIDFAREVPLGTREVLVRTRVAEVGRTSVTFEQEALREDGEVAAAARTVLVAYDRDERRAKPVSDADRAALLRR